MASRMLRRKTQFGHAVNKLLMADRTMEVWTSSLAHVDAFMANVPFERWSKEQRAAAARRLTRLKFFTDAAISFDKVLEMLPRLAHLRLNKNDKIFAQGERTDYFYIILTGSVRFRREREDGPPQRLSVFGPGESFGELGFLTGRNRAASAMSGEGTRHTRLPYREG